MLKMFPTFLKISIYFSHSVFCNVEEFVGQCLQQPVQCYVNPLNAELNPICYLLALLGAHHFLHVSRIRVKLH